MRNNDLEFEYQKREDGFIYVNEDRLEEEIMHFLETGQDVEKLRIPEDISRDAYLSLTSKRENVIRWYPFKKDASILEIGAGYGEITGYLCSQGKKVSAYELKKERLAIIRKRCETANNLTCYSGFLEAQDFGEKFDYILLHDIFAICRKFFKGEDPNVTMLEFLKTFLKKDGKLLLVTENRLGMKYFAGAAEDYTQQFFWGLNSFEQDERNRTFSREELKEIISGAGFTCQNWYYPYPNAVIPLEIYTEQIEEKIWYGLTTPDYECCGDRYLLFDEQRMFYTFHKENMAYQFANAFIVECCLYQSSSNIAYVNLEKDYTITRREEGFVQEGAPLPPGIRLDIYLCRQVQKIVNCNLGKMNPYISELYEMLGRVAEELRYKDYDMDDFYVYQGKLFVINRKELPDTHSEYHRWEFFYRWYNKDIMFYRNAFRRIKLENIMDIASICEENISNYVEHLNSQRDNYIVPRLPQMMFDFEAGGSKDALEFRLEEVERENLAENLKKLHKGLMDEGV